MLQIHHHHYSALPHQVPALADDELHVWFYHCHQAQLSACADDNLTWPLDTTEQQRARAFVTAQLRQHFRAAHWGKRWLLAAYLGLAPEQLAFTTGRYGKPALAQPVMQGRADQQAPGQKKTLKDSKKDNRENNQTAGPIPTVSSPFGSSPNTVTPYGLPLHFNLSHSNGWAALALARGGTGIGVDIETLGNSGRWRDIRPQVLHPDEHADNSDDFYRLWCAKEAAAKWDSRGLGMVFSQLHIAWETAAAPAATPAHWLGRIHYQPEPQLRCFVCPLPAAAGMAAAVAWSHPVQRIHCFSPSSNIT